MSFGKTMYESNDWDFDEDYLKDFENINTSFDEGDRTDLKKRKIDDNSSFFSSTLNSQSNLNNVENTQNESNINRKNKVLKLLNKAPDNTKEKPVIESQCFLKMNETQPRNTQSSQVLSRRQRVAELFKNRNSNTQNKDIDTKQNKNTPLSQSNSRDFSVTSQSQIKTAKPSEKPLISEKLSQTSNSKFKTSTQSAYEPKPGTSKDSEMWLSQEQETNSHCEIISSTSAERSNSKLKASTIEKRNLVIECFKKSADSILPKRTLVRKFPGPAGLLPDNVDESIPEEIIDNHNLNEASTMDFETTAFCSQRTKNLFTEGAWQLMLDDLPNNFLKGYDIVSVKQKAKSKKFKNNKVPFMAGIVQTIDYSSNNPKIVLKDFSGEIECCLHCKIINKYPNVLDYGVVILLREVGLIASKSYLYAMVSLNSLVSIYTHKERVVSTPNLVKLQLKDSSENNNQNLSELREHVNEEHFKTLDTHHKTNSFEINNFFGDDIESHKENSNFQDNLQGCDKNIQQFSEFEKNPCSLISNVNNEKSDLYNIIQNKREQDNSKLLVKEKDEDKLDNFFDMDDEAFFTVDEHISQVEQSFFSSTVIKNRKIESFKCNDSHKNEHKPLVQSPIDKIKSFKNNKKLNQEIITKSEKSASQKKVPSDFLNISSNRLLNTKNTEINEIKSQEDNSVKNKSEPTNGANVNSAKFKLLQFKRHVDETLPANIPSIETESQSAEVKARLNDDLFSCDDDILMSQIELDSLET